ncbi:hypothetical protein ENBRE01_2824 [Enteropsectra breve]|nr:hypothetical protein ENBRE01_2254 [Enteropsectra breve]KAI5152429.1 hypothetical protein ENBRE01_2824 [Enteropsectra breve]
MERLIDDAVDMRANSEHNDGVSWILSIVDAYSKFAWSYRLRCKSAAAVADVFKSLFYSEGVPKILHCDNGKEFKNSELDQLCSDFNVCRVYGRVHHLQS